MNKMCLTWFLVFLYSSMMTHAFLTTIPNSNLWCIFAFIVAVSGQWCINNFKEKQ